VATKTKNIESSKTKRHSFAVRVSMLAMMIAIISVLGSSWTPLSASGAMNPSSASEFSTVLVGSPFQDGVNDGRDALKKQKRLPWYDSENDEVKFSNLPDIETAPVQTNTNKSVAKKKRAPNTGKAPAGGGATGTRTDGAFVMNIIFWVVVAVILITFLALLVWAFLKVEFKEQQLEEQVVEDRPIDTKASVEDLPFQMPSGPTGDWLSVARGHFESGNFKSAIIYLYSHVLFALDNRGLVRLTRGKTNRQYLTEIQRHRDIAEYMEKCMLPFEDAFFGDIDVTADEIKNCLDGIGQFESQLSQASVVH